MPSLSRRVRFEHCLYFVIVGSVLLTSALLLFLITRQINDASEETADQAFRQAVAHVESELGLLLGVPVKSVSILADQPAAAAPIAGDGLDHPAVPVVTAMLRHNPDLYSGYVGRADGSFLQVIATRGDARIIKAQAAPDGTATIVRTITPNGGGRIERWTFLDQAGVSLGRTERSDPSYDPRQRPWYTDALARPDADLGQPYVFDSIRAPGITASRRLPTADGVAGVDMTLTRLGTLVQSQKASPRSILVLATPNDRLLAAAPEAWGGGDAPAPLSDLRADAHLAGGLLRLPNDGSANRRADAAALGVADGAAPAWPLIVRRATLLAGSQGEMRLAIAAPLEDFNGSVGVLRNRILLFSALLLLLLLPANHLGARRLSHTLTLLADEARRIREWDFSGSSPERSSIREFGVLSDAFSTMKEHLVDRTRRLENAQDQLARLIEVGIAMSAERDVAALTHRILAEAKALTHADGGTLYVRKGDELEFRIVLNDTLGIAPKPGEAPAETTLVPLYETDGRPDHRHVASHAAHTRASVNIVDAYDTASGFDFSGTREFDMRNGYRSRSMLTIPLMPRGGEVIGVVQLINARDPDTGADAIFTVETQRIAEALASVASMALYNRMLLDGQAALTESLIKVTVSAIDAKSPYTGGHCSRVPELAMLLARAACDITAGPLADFRFENEDEWYEFQVGCWLHDCGKLTTPEHIVDKATKLETLFNRIHEIRTRFEVLLRDSEIAMLRAILDGADAATAQREHAARAATLHDEYAFIANCNVGGEFQSAEANARVREIGQREWLRHFDDRIGLSHIEVDKLKDTPPPPLPAVEMLLADKPHHRVKRAKTEGLYPDHLNIRMKIPENISNEGEIHNLSISRGTLTEEDRFVVNDHIIQTSIMVDHMPFPPHLRRVPEYASTHHETMSGTGYPRRLDGSTLSVPARIMMIADIFEALTASDRPYKKAKSLSEAIDILNMFRKNNHIDADLFELFLTSGVYKDYAARFLMPEQIDTVDVAKYLQPAAAAAN